MFRGRHFNFMRGDLEQVLFHALEGGVRLWFNRSPVAIDPAGPTAIVKTDRGAPETFDLVVGADGSRSRVRRLAFTDGESVTSYLGCHTAAFVAARPVAGLPADAFVTMSAPGFGAAAYPFRGDHTATFFIHRSDQRLVDRSPCACRRELEATYRGRGWALDQLLDAFPDDSSVYFDEVAQVEALRFHRGRVVLLGDAAGCVSLLGGQGASLAMYGAFALARELQRQPLDVEAALTGYEARVHPVIKRRLRAALRNRSWFLPRSNFGTMVRDGLTRAAASAPIAWMLGRALGGARAPLD